MKSFSHARFFATPWIVACIKLLCPWDFQGKSTGVGYHFLRDGSDGKASACNAGDLGLIPGLGRYLEKKMATHSSVLAWKIPWTEEPDRL